MAAPTVEELTARLHQFSGDMQKSREGAEGIVNSFTELLNKLLPVGVALKGFQVLSGGMFAHYGKALTSLTLHTGQLYAQRRELQGTLVELRKKLDTGEILAKQYADAKKEAAATFHVMRAQRVLAGELERVGRATLGVAALFLGAMVKTFDTTIRYNEALLEANATFSHRLELMQAMGRVQVSTGTAQATLVNATRSLVRYGLESKSTFEDNLKTVVMLHDAVGLSTDEAAHLAAVTENYAKASFQDVANVVATIVSQTSLAAAEVKNLGIELQRALGVITPGQTNLPQVIQALGGYEAALKEVTGRVGSFQKMVTNLATPEGMMQAGMLGVTPEMIQTREGIDMIMTRFEGLVNRVVGNSEGLNRVWRLDAMAKMMNLSREEVSEMVRAMELKRGMDLKELTLQELYAQQMGNLNQGVMRLVNALSSLMQQGLYPLVRVLSWVINGLAGLIQKMVDWRGAAYVAFTVVTVAIGVTVYALRRVWSAFLLVAQAVDKATQKLYKHAAAQQLTLPLGGGGGAAGGGGGAGGWVSRSFSWLMTPFKSAWGVVAAIGLKISSFFTSYSVGFLTFRQTLMMSLRAVIAGISFVTLGVAAVAAVVAYFGYKRWRTNKDSADDNARVNRALSQRSQKLEQSQRERAYLSMRYGSTEEALATTSRMMRDTAQRMTQIEGKSIEEANAELARMQTQAVEDLTMAYATRTRMSQDYSAGKFDPKAWNVLMARVMEQIAEDMRKTQINTRNSVSATKEQQGEAVRNADDQNTLWKLISQGRLTVPGTYPGK